MRQIFALSTLIFALVGCRGDDPDQGEASDVTLVFSDGGVRVDASAEDASAEDASAEDASTAIVGCQGDQCTIDGLCFDNLEARPDNACEVCSVVTDPTGWTADDSAQCDDDDACTADDHCDSAACGMR